jgi:CRP/FNR family cyclic AMP-dependent transcriptional regulator
MTGMRRSETREVVRLLAGLPAFGECSARDLADLATHAHRSRVPAHWPLIQHESPADACYVLLDGTASVTVEGTPVATVGPGGVVVGETALARGRLRNGRITSTTSLDLLHIDAGQFTRLVDRQPALRATLLARIVSEAIRA